MLRNRRSKVILAPLPPPRVALIWPNSSQIPLSARVQSNSDKIGRLQANFDRVRLNPPQIWSSSANILRTSARTWMHSVQHRSRSAQHVPPPAKLCGFLPNFGGARPTLGRLRATLGRVRRNLHRICSIWADCFRRDVGQARPNRLNLGQTWPEVGHNSACIPRVCMAPALERSLVKVLCRVCEYRRARFFFPCVAAQSSCLALVLRMCQLDLV